MLVVVFGSVVGSAHPADIPDPEILTQHAADFVSLHEPLVNVALTPSPGLSLGVPFSVSTQISTVIDKLNASVEVSLGGLADPAAITFPVTLAGGVPFVQNYEARAILPGVYPVTVTARYAWNEEELVGVDALWFDLRGRPEVLRYDPLKTAPSQGPPAWPDGNGTATHEGGDRVTLGGPSNTVAAQGTLSFRLTFEVDNGNPQYWAECGCYSNAYYNQRMRWAYVELWDREGCCSGDYFLRSAYLDINGFVAWDVSNDDGWFQGTLDPFVKLRTYGMPTGQNGVKGEVQNPDTGSWYEYRWDWGDNLPDQTITQTKTVNDVDATNAGAAYIEARLMEGYRRATHWGNVFSPPYALAYWKPGYTPDNPCTSQADPRDGAFFASCTERIYIAGTDARMQHYDGDVVLHEYGHFLMWEAYDNWLSPNGGGPHFTGQCLHWDSAYIEGWADFFQSWAQYLSAEGHGAFGGHQIYRDYDSGGSSVTYNLESPYTTPGGCPDQQDYEEEVGGDLWDFQDGVADDDNGVGSGSDRISWYGVEEFRTIRNYRVTEPGGAVRGIANMREWHVGFDTVVPSAPDQETHDTLSSHAHHYNNGFH